MKFLRNINDKITRSSKLAIVEIHFSNEGDTIFNGGIYETKKNTISLKEIYSDEKGIEEILKKIKDKNIPLVLCADGKGILCRKINMAFEDIDENSCGKIIPNANPDDFYMEAIVANETSSFIAIARRNLLDPFIDEIKCKGFFVMALHLGPLPISCVAQVLTEDKDIAEKVFRNYKLTLSGNGLMEIVSQSTQSEENTELLKFAVACAFFSKWDEANAKTFSHTVKERKQEFFEKRKFNFYAAASVIFFVLTLLINFLVFQHNWNKKQLLESQIGWQENALKNYGDLKKNLDEKMNFAIESGILSENNLGFLSDQLASTVPNGIRLNRMDVFPVEKKMENGDEKYSFNKHLISVQGQSLSGEGINDWIKKLKQKKFVKDVQLTNYKQDDENIKGFFSMKIFVN